MEKPLIRRKIQTPDETLKRDSHQMLVETHTTGGNLNHLRNSSHQQPNIDQTKEMIPALGVDDI